MTGPKGKERPCHVNNLHILFGEADIKKAKGHGNSWGQFVDTEPYKKSMDIIQKYIAEKEAEAAEEEAEAAEATATQDSSCAIVSFL